MNFTKVILKSFFLISICNLLHSQDAPFIVDENTIGLWHFDEVSEDTLFDETEHELFGLLQQGATWDATGKFGGCVSFSANYHRVFVEDNPLLDFESELTIDAWIYLEANNNAGVIVSKWNSSSFDPPGQYVMGVNVAHNIYFEVVGDSAVFFILADSVFAFETWILVTAVFDHGLLGIFVDGNQVASGVAPFDRITNQEYANDDLYIGDLWTDAWFPYSFEGKIDEVRISDIARYPVISDVAERGIPLKLHPRLIQNYPNPFNPITTIDFTIPEPDAVKIEIFNLLGQSVQTLLNKRMPAGHHELVFDGSKLPSGIYLYKMQSGTFQVLKKMVLIK